MNIFLYIAGGLAWVAAALSVFWGLAMATGGSGAVAVEAFSLAAGLIVLAIVFLALGSIVGLLQQLVARAAQQEARSPAGATGT